MLVEQASTAKELLAQNSGKIVLAFVAGFALFAAGVLISNRIHDGGPDVAQRVVHSPGSKDAASAPAAIVKEDAAKPQPLRTTSPKAGNHQALKQPAATSELSRPDIEFRPRKTQPLKPAAALPVTRKELWPGSEDFSHAMEPESEGPVAEATPVKAAIAPVTAADTVVPVRLSTLISTMTSSTGQLFQGFLAADVLAEDGTIVASQGAAVRGRIVAARRAGLIAHQSFLSMEVIGIANLSGRSVPVRTTQWYARGDHSRLITGILLRRRRKITDDEGAASGMARKADGDIVLDPNSVIQFRLLTPLAGK